MHAASAALFGGGELSALDEADAARGAGRGPVAAGRRRRRPAWSSCWPTASGLSRSDARRAVKEGGAYLNNARVVDEAAVPAEADWLHGRFLVLRRGKRSMLVVERV